MISPRTTVLSPSPSPPSPRGLVRGGGGGVVLYTRYHPGTRAIVGGVGSFVFSPTAGGMVRGRIVRVLYARTA